MKRSSRRKAPSPKRRRTTVKRKISVSRKAPSRSRIRKSVSVKPRKTTPIRSRLSTAKVAGTRSRPRSPTTKIKTSRKTVAQKTQVKKPAIKRTPTKPKQLPKRDEKGRFISTSSNRKTKSVTKKNTSKKAPSGKAGNKKASSQKNTKKKTPRSSPQKNLINYIEKNGSASSKNKELHVAKNMPITGGSLEKQEQIASTVADNFTKKEIDCMIKSKDDLVITVGEVKKEGADGSFKRKYGPEDKIEITIEDKADSMAIAHEFIHLSRMTDKSRKGVSQTVFPTDKNGITNIETRDGPSGGKLINAEESATSAEAALRVNQPGSAPRYFENLGKKNPYDGRYEHPSKNENMLHDRKVLRTNKDGKVVPDGTVIKGEEANKKMVRNYKSTRISKRSIGDETAEETSRKSMEGK